MQRQDLPEVTLWSRPRDVSGSCMSPTFVYACREVSRQPKNLNLEDFFR